MDGGEEKVPDPGASDTLEKKALRIRGLALLAAVLLTALAMTLPS